MATTTTDSNTEFSQLNLKLVRSFERISTLEDELHAAREANSKLTKRNALLELEAAQHKEALKGGILVERANVQLELQRLTQRVTLESERRSQSEASLSTINQELDDLSASLFTEANRLVAAEKLQRIQAERKVSQVEEAMKRVEELIQARRDQTNQLRLSLEAAEAERDQYRNECEALRRNSKPSASETSTGSIINHSGDSLPSHPSSTIINHHHHHHPSTPLLKLSQEIIPFTEFLQFIHHLRRIRQDALPRPFTPAHTLSESYFSPATPTTTPTPTPHSHPISSSSSSASSFPSSKDPPPLDPKDSITPFLPLSQHLSQPFLKRCLEEDSDPALRLDLAPGLNFLSRRATLTALLEGNLVIEPVWSESGQASEFQSCTLCGCSLDPWLSARASSTGSTHHTPSNSASTTASAMRKMLRGGAWSFGAAIGKPKRSSHPVHSTQPAPEKSALAPSVSLKLPSSGRNTPNSDHSDSLHIHTFKTVDGSSTRYPICPTYCLARLRAVCHFWTFVRSLERGLLLDETFWFTHYINQPPPSSRFTETHSLGLAYDHALKRIRGQNHQSIDSFEGSPPLTHSLQSAVFNTAGNTPEPPPENAFLDTTDKTPNLEQSSTSSAKESVDDHAPCEEALQPNPELHPPQTPDPIRPPQPSPSPSPTSTTAHDLTPEAIQVGHPDQPEPAGISLAIRPAILSTEVPILSPAPSPAVLRRSPGRSLSQTISTFPSLISKARGTTDDSSPSSNLKPSDGATDATEQLEEARDTLDLARSVHTHPGGDSHGAPSTRLPHPLRSAPMPSLQHSLHHHLHNPSSSQSSSIEMMEPGWEEKCWHQVIKLKEEMFFKRVGLTLVSN
ncbi:hypothetical protein PTTG_07514 [Puccinia triticina 1-1 BBBD Race 1]|uniref:Sec2p domain-containing protein n=1 Tax=Puccinia triticina (isolate 1-1 / race 1 (BBBD)) TaxID=630390 RepID=A0A180GBZ9_PUCT1|nr:hypothetical protein PTTG_07514 [Puccinia triticina 1-1 BBBD Race 1]